MPWGFVDYSAQTPEVRWAPNEAGIILWVDGAINAGMAEKFGQVVPQTMGSISETGNSGLGAVEHLENRELVDFATRSLSNV